MWDPFLGKYLLHWLNLCVIFNQIESQGADLTMSEINTLNVTQKSDDLIDIGSYRKSEVQRGLTN